MGQKKRKYIYLEDMVIVRLKGKLLPIEEKLLEGEEGIGLVKKYPRKNFMKFSLKI